jgi:hypothetical protein
LPILYILYILTTSIPGKFEVDSVIPSRVKGAWIIYIADVSIILKGRYKLRGFPNLSRNISVSSIGKRGSGAGGAVHEAPPMTSSILKYFNLFRSF